MLYILALFFCAILCIGAVFSFSVNSSKAYAYKSIDTDKLISNIYNSRTGKFYYDNVNAIAVAAGFSNLEELVNEANQAPHDSSWAYTGSSKFEEGTSVNFGSYEFGGETYELNWIPVYLSNDKDGNAVLTLWLSNAEDSNGLVSNQEVSTFTDGTYDGNHTHIFNDNTVVSNTYSSSYIHNYILNGRATYDVGYDTVNETDEVKNYWQNPPSRETLTKFSAFAEGGEVSSYIIAPQDVPWQMSLSEYGNDPSYTSDNSQYFNNDWTKDKVWLPSMSESCRKTDMVGLWKLTNAMCGYNGSTDGGVGYWWTRSASHGWDGGWGLNREGWQYDWRYIGKWIGRVRPAIHLNLSLVADNVEYAHIHSFGEWQVITPATCTTDGVKTRKCSASNCTLPDGKETETIPATGVHKYIAVVTQPTCTTGGYTTHTCSMCGDSYVDSETPAIHHSWSEWEHNDNATNHTRSCQNAGCMETESQPHSFSGWETDKEATEEANGSRHRDCTECSYRQTETIPQLDHTHVYGEWIEEVAPTCTQSGTKGHYTCKCGLNFDNEHREISDLVIEQRGHTSVIDEAVEATCTTAGKTAGKHCSVCNEVLEEQKEVSALGHDYKAAEGGKAPTCTEDGYGKLVCSRCGDEKQGEVIPALGHNFATEWTDDETNHWHVCTVCGEKSEEAAHSYEWEITTPPTEETEGEKKEKCTVCGHFGATETIAKLIKDPNGNGDVSDLPPDKDYDLDIEVTETGSLYHLEGINKGYAVNLYVVDGEQKTPYDNTKTVTLSLAIPEGMSAESFTLYKLEGGVYKEITDYKVSGRIITVRTTLSAEFVFNAPKEPAAGIPWWVWLLAGLAGAAVVGVVIVIMVVAKKKSEGAVVADNGEVLKILGEHGEKIDELIEISDGGFNDRVDE